jgi:hypothetical protein
MQNEKLKMQSGGRGGGRGGQCGQGQSGRVCDVDWGAVLVCLLTLSSGETRSDFARQALKVWEYHRLSNTKAYKVFSHRVALAGINLIAFEN